MMRSLLLKTLYDKRWFILGWCFIIVLISWLVILFFPSLKDGFNISAIAEHLPKQLQSVLGDIASYSSLDGYITAQLFDIRLPLWALSFRYRDLG